jgi:hypothetical protein
MMYGKAYILFGIADMKVALVFAFATIFGVLLATVELPIRPGLLGVTVMLLGAIALRRRWLQLPLSAPGSPERALWIGFTAVTIVTAHLTAVLYQLGPELALHSRASHAFGVDNWTLLGGGFLAWLIARDPEPREDERDQQIAARGLCAGHWSFVLLTTCFALALAFSRAEWLVRANHASIAQALILLLSVSLLVEQGSRLVAYLGDAAQAQRQLDEDEQ